MTYFKLNRFFGTAPAVSPRLLNEQFGQTAENLDLESGRLVAIKDDVVFLVECKSSKVLKKAPSYKDEFGDFLN